MADKQSFNVKASIPTQQDEARLARAAPGTITAPTVPPSKPPFHRTTLTFAQKTALKDFLSLYILKRDPPDSYGRTHYYFAGFTDKLIAKAASEDLHFFITTAIVRKLRMSLFGPVATDPSKDPAAPPSPPHSGDTESRLTDLENELEMLKTEIRNINKFLVR